MLQSHNLFNRYCEIFVSGLIKMLSNNMTNYSKTSYCHYRVRVRLFKATFNNISVISWQSVLLVDETGVPGENHRPVVSH